MSIYPQLQFDSENSGKGFTISEDCRTVENTDPGWFSTITAIPTLKPGKVYIIKAKIDSTKVK
jgi:hypothetical protein